MGRGIQPTQRRALGLSDLVQPARGMWDMGAATTRGVARGTLGLPGDLESLVRLLTGGEQVLPTSEDWHKKLPPLYPDKPELKNPYDELGMFYSLPIYGSAINAGSKGIKKLGGKMVGGDTNIGRREFAKKAGAVAVGSTALAKALKYLDEVAPLTKQVDEVAPAAKVANKHKFNSLKEYNEYLKDRAIDETNIKYSELGHDGYSGSQYEKSLEDAYRNIAKQEEIAYKEFKDYSTLTNHKTGKPLSRDEAARELAENRLMYDRDPPGVLESTPEDIATAQKEWMETIDRWSPNIKRSMDDSLDAFSPQAKAEMKQFKDSYNKFIDSVYQPRNDRWPNYLEDWVSGEAQKYF